MENEKYNFKEIEKKWQDKWEKEGIYKTEDFSEKEKFYALDMFPFPSGAGLHVGHPKGYIATDVVARFKMLNGFNVLHPMGWDAFGLPAENYAIKNKIHPRAAVEKNIERYKEQLKKIGFAYDWEREINTSEPNYYKWTQWIFLKMFEKGLAYESDEPINWCPSCKTGLANEDLEDGKCERCGTPVEQKKMKQWVLKITDYADRLLYDLDNSDLDWEESTKEQQRNWIGRSAGASLKFKVPSKLAGRQSLKFKKELEVFTTRPDTLWGCTYLVVSPEYKEIGNWKLEIGNWKDVENYIEEAKKKSEMERMDAGKEKTGVKIEGILAVNPANGEEIPIFVADYVLSGYGTGAIMAVPAHDERDFEFAKKYNLPIEIVIEPVTGKIHEGEENKKSIVAIVQDPKNKKLLSISWGSELGGNLFIGGGMDEGENSLDCAIREILEETGYKNIKLISQSEAIHHHYFAHSKGKYKSIDVQGFYFELVNDEREDQKLEHDEAGKFKVEWIGLKEAEKKVYDPLHKYLFDKFIKEKIYSGDGILANSGEFTGLKSEEAKEKIIEWLEENKIGERKVNYKMRDWVFSRQRYWGEPIPIIHCESCGLVPVPEDQLPLELPEVESYEPTGTGESPLANIPEWTNTICPKCGGPAKRETNTMPNWAGSSWYYLRYIDPKNNQALVDQKKEKCWMPVNLYVGGAEHATRHLLYARFWHKFLYDIGVVSTNEPFKKLVHVGLINAGDGRKMSKRWSNVINPDDIIEKFGADALRMYEMFMGPFIQNIAWSTDGVKGVKRFLDRVWVLKSKVSVSNIVETQDFASLHKTIKKATEDIEQFKFNTAISALMILINEMEKQSEVLQDDFGKFLILLSPFAPHLAEELWFQIGNRESIFKPSFAKASEGAQKWPEYDPELIKENEIEIPVQINGKVRDTIKISVELSEEEIKKTALESEKVKKWLDNKAPRKIIYIKDKMISIVV